MENKILLNIGIPTCNRARFLENLLNNILPQAVKTEGEVKICISDNGSTDNTEQIVAKFRDKFPGLVNYNKNPKNLGFDRNILKVMEMSQGEFVWLLGDDDLTADGALEEVINFIKKNKREEIGLVFLETESYFIDEKTNQKIVWSKKLNKGKPAIFEIDRKDIIGISLPGINFMSALVINNKLLKEIFKEDEAAIKKAIGNFHIHMILLSLMFSKYPRIKGFVLNKRPLINQELFYHKLFVEDEFMLHYRAQKRIRDLLLSYEHMDNSCTSSIIKIDKKLRRGFIVNMIIMRAFKNFNYFSFFGCLKLFFQEAVFIDALVFSFIFLVLFLAPPAVLSFLYKVLLMIKHGKKWKFKWDAESYISSVIAKAEKREAL
jgi:glycosyltransferase involved in cell wall biosynthesis